MGGKHVVHYYSYSVIISGARSALSRSTAPHAHPVPMRLLIIEDEEDFAVALARGLRDQGYAVDIALDGEQGCDYNEQRSPSSLGQLTPADFARRRSKTLA